MTAPPLPANARAILLRLEASAADKARSGGWRIACRMAAAGLRIRIALS